MTYNTLERIMRQAVCNTIGARSKDFNQWLVTEDINEGMEIIEQFDFLCGPCVELGFDPQISPFTFFSSDVAFYVNGSIRTSKGALPASIHAFFGCRCSDAVEADKTAEIFFDRGVDDGWYIEDCFEEGSGLHLVYELGLDIEDEEAFAAALEKALNELLDPLVANALRSFIHYFED
jgi:hypothetical protein